MNIFPWRSRHLRRADVEEARRRATEAERQAEQADLIKKDIHRMMADNHFVNAIHEVITGRPVPRLPGS